MFCDDMIAFNLMPCFKAPVVRSVLVPEMFSVTLSNCRNKVVLPIQLRLVM